MSDRLELLRELATPGIVIPALVVLALALVALCAVFLIGGAG